MLPSRVEFGADGIRGTMGEWPFSRDGMLRIGQALGQFVHTRSEHPFVVIGRDTRPSGASLVRNLSACLTDQGVDVIGLGVMTTPGVAFITRRLQADLGVIVSASHNPLEYNGIKLVKQNGLRLQREEEIELESLINKPAAGNIKRMAASGQQTDGRHLIELYIQDHVERCPAKSLKGFTVVLDCANGAASRIAPEVFRRLGAQVIVINDDVEGEGINDKCGSEHAREYPEDLASTMHQHEATYGFAFDGDGDRLVVVDSNGKIFDGIDFLFVLARYFHRKNLLRGNVVVTIHQANRGLEEALQADNIRVIPTNNGDRNLEAAMWGGGDYLLGGEPGGNIIMNDGHHTAADAVYAAIVLGGVLLLNQRVGLSEMVAPLQKRPQISLSLELPSTITLEQRAMLQDQINRMKTELGEDSRILTWESTTEPGIIKVMIEGNRENTQGEVSKVADAICQAIQQTASGISNHPSDQIMIERNL